MAGTFGGLLLSVGSILVAFVVYKVFDGMSAISFATLVAVIAATAALFATFEYYSRTLIRFLQEAADLDALTGIANRRSFENVLAGVRHGRKPFGVLMIDIDRFKLLNDTYGHAAGDAVLVEMADALRRAVRASDTVARVGGEEFAALLPDADADEMAVVAERVRGLVAAETFRFAGKGLSVTVSVGGAVSSPASFRAETVWREADTALYQAKRSGRNRVVLVATDNASSDVETEFRLAGE